MLGALICMLHGRVGTSTTADMFVAHRLRVSVDM